MRYVTLKVVCKVPDGIDDVDVVSLVAKVIDVGYSDLQDSADDYELEVDYTDDLKRLLTVDIGPVEMEKQAVKQ